MRGCKRSVGALAVVALTGLVASGSAGASVSPGQNKFAALRHAPTSAPPAAVAKFLKSQGERGVDVDVAQTRRVAAPGGGTWDVTPGDGVICLFVESEQTGGCVSTANALAGRLNFQFVEPSNDFGKAGSVPADTARSQVGLLPDDVVSTTASPKLGGAASARPNVNGLYRLSGTGDLGTVTVHRFNKRPTAITKALKWKAAPSTPTAKAASCPCIDYIPAGYNNWAFYSGGNYGPYGRIWWVYVKSWDTNTICGGARNPDQTWAGTFFCTADTQYGIYHYYDNTYYRSGWAGPGYPSASVWGQASEEYLS
jgi:hypothetical protein